MHIDTFHSYFSLGVHAVGLRKMKYSLLGVFCRGEYFVREHRRIKSCFYKISMKIICVEGYESKEHGRCNKSLSTSREPYKIASGKHRAPKDC